MKSGDRPGNRPPRNANDRETATRLEGDFDYIVVGAGSAGCVLANRLSADPSSRVLLLEAGGRDNWIWFHIPVGYLFAIGNPRSDWMFETEKEPGLNGRSLNYPRGKVIGGCSAINAMISMRGQAADYDHWRQLGLAGWGWDDVRAGLQAARQSFPRRHRASRRRRRMAGRAAARADGPCSTRSTAAANEMGIPDDAGLQHRRQYRRRLFPRQPEARRALVGGARLPEAGAQPRQPAARDRRAGREGAVRGQARGRRAVTGRTARLVEARAKGEVILSAGAVGSPQILQLSGVGPAEWLGELGIAVVHDKPGVGRNLQDHLQQRAIFKVHGVKTLNETYHSLVGRALMGAEYALFQTGPLTMAPSQLGIFTTSSPEHERANIQFHVQPLSLDKFGEPLHRFPGRHGQRLQSAADLARHDPAALGRSCRQAGDRAQLSRRRHEDRRVAADAIRVTRRLMKQPRSQPYRPEEFLPGPPVGDDDASLAKAAGDIGTTIFHPVGTAKMGLPSDPMAVVDERLRVIGLEGLRVIDASVMPTITSGNTNTPTIMIAEKAGAHGDRGWSRARRARLRLAKARPTVPRCRQICRSKLRIGRRE